MKKFLKAVYVMVCKFFRAAAEELDDPVEQRRIAISRGKKKAVEYQKQISSLIAKTKMIEEKVDEQVERLPRLRSEGKKAFKAENLGLAKSCAGQVANIEKMVNDYKSTIEVNNKTIEKVETHYTNLTIMLDRAEMDITRMQTTYTAQEIRAEMLNATNKLTDDVGIIPDMEGLSNDLKEEDFRLDAMEDLQGQDVDSIINESSLDAATSEVFESFKEE